MDTPTGKVYVVDAVAEKTGAVRHCVELYRFINCERCPVTVDVIIKKIKVRKEA